MNSKITGLILLAFSAILLGGAFLYNNTKRQIPVIFSNKELLRNTYGSYKNVYIENGNSRTLDLQRNNITTSEGQSYTMLRAVWMDDKTTFDFTWKWTKENLVHKDDSLPAWLFGQRPDGSYGILTDQGGGHTATDGDVDIATALLMAHGRWSDPAYLETAKLMISDIWKYEVVEIKGKPVLASNNIERENKESIIINPSYFSPHAFREFAKVDKAHDWNGLADNSYKILNTLTTDPLSSQKAVLPPNWAVMSRVTGALSASTSKDLTTDYGYDAMRIPWRIAMDFNWHGSKDSQNYLNKLKFLSTQYQADGKLASVYSHSGSIVSENESPAMYGSSIGYFLVSDPQLAERVYQEKLKTLYSSDKNSWNIALGYYDDNWAWFGLALASGQLPNLTGL